VYSRLKIAFQDPFLEENLIWKAVKVDQIRCQDTHLQPKYSSAKIQRDCVLVLTDDTIDEGHGRYEVAQTHLFFEFFIDGKHFRLALLRYFDKEDNQKHATGMTRLKANPREKAEVVSISSITR
jgi:hypothetical protein